MTHTSQTPKAGHAVNQIFCYGLYNACMHTCMQCSENAVILAAFVFVLRCAVILSYHVFILRQELR